VCDSIHADYDDCRDGRVVEYDLRTMKPIATHRFFSPSFYGRLELMECLPDEVQVAVQGAVLQGRAILQSALAFPAEAPSMFAPAVAGPGMGITIAYDERHEAFFYTGEFTHRLVRYDRRRRELSEVASDAFARRWIQPISLRTFTGSSLVYTNSIHPARNRVYVVEFMNGRYAYAIDLTSLEVVARYDVGSGGAAGVTVDADRDRLLVSSLWGLEVFDLATDTLIVRKRLGLGNRSAIVDTRRNRVYVGSTVEGKIRVLDRDTLEVIGQLPVGIGSRFPHLSADGERLFASSTVAHYYWDPDTLAPGS
jgi:DNA-binding beta-propeller fold protein YncE